MDAWLTHPVNTATAGTGQGLGVIRNDHAFDQAEKDITFGGGRETYKGVKDHTLDTFFLWSEYDKLVPGGNGFPPVPPNSFPLGDI